MRSVLASTCHRSARMNISLSLGPLAALIAGILILILPRLLNYIVAIYLILIGVVGLFGTRF
jgi:Protein of unknown function (DUF3096)